MKALSLLVLAVLARNARSEGNESQSLCLTGSTPFVLSDACAPGWYCPLYNASDSSTYPAQCAATNDCILDRLSTLFCPPQGVYEPVLCEKGYYCPTPTEKIRCPEGHICPLGQFEPVSCGAMTLCPEGSTKKFEWSSLLALFLTDIGAVIIYFLALWWRAKKRQERDVLYPHHHTTHAVDQGEKENSANPQSGISLLPLTLTTQLAISPAEKEYVLDGDIESLKGKEDDDDSSVSEENADIEKGVQSSDAANDVRTVAHVAHSAHHRHTEIICESFRRARGTLPPMLIEFRNLSLSIPALSRGGEDSSGGEMKQREPLHLLRGVTCSIMPGTVTAIMGPSGAGKTMLLTAMLGKISPAWTRHGELTINGREEDLSRFQKVIGYVSQDDILHRELTVYENVMYSANVRLPRSWTFAEKQRLVCAVLAALKLSHVQDVTVGDEVIRGVSGGQRKRCSVAVELAAAPSLLLLDEPTSGLDSTASMQLCALLKDLAQQSQLTVAMVIHQPRVEIWQSLDDLLLLAPGGRTVYQGPQSLAASYFKDHAQVEFRANDNPADVLMDRIGSHGMEYAKLWTENGLTSLKETSAKRNEGIEIVHDVTQMKLSPFDTKQPLRTTMSFPAQIFFSAERNLWQQIARLSSLWLELGLALVAGGIMGSAGELMYQGVLTPPYTLLSPTPLEGLIPQFFYNVGMTISLAAASAGVSVFGEELVTYRKEISSGHGHCAYYIGVSLAQLPRIFLDSMHYAALFHVQNQTLTPFRIFFVITFFLYLAVYGLAAIVSMCVSRQNAALLAVVVSLFFSTMVRKGSIFPEPVQWFSASRWAAEIVFDYETRPYKHIMQVEEISADMSGYVLDRIPQDLGIMFLIGVFYRVLAYIAMCYTDRHLLNWKIPFPSISSSAKDVVI